MHIIRTSTSHLSANLVTTTDGYSQLNWIHPPFSNTKTAPHYSEQHSTQRNPPTAYSQVLLQKYARITISTLLSGICPLSSYTHSSFSLCTSLISTSNNASTLQETEFRVYPENAFITAVSFRSETGKRALGIELVTDSLARWWREAVIYQRWIHIWSLFHCISRRSAETKSCTCH